jgi:hypothetical protein
MHAKARGSESENPPRRGSGGGKSKECAHGDYVLHRDEQQPSYPEPDPGAC